VENLEPTQSKTQTIEFRDYVVENKSRIEVPRILEQLKKISELKLDNFTQLREAKFESTVKEMFSIIKELEGHLRDVLTLNASLREEVRDRRKVKEELQQEKVLVQHKIASLEQDFPRVQDLERKLELTIAEVDKYRAIRKREQAQHAQLEAENHALAALIGKTREERDDAYREIVVMEDKLKSLSRAES